MAVSPGAELTDLLDALVRSPDEQDEIERRIVERFTEEKAIVVLDMTGFSRATQARGPVLALLMIHRMRLVSEPLIELWGGVVIKSEADNLFAVFETVDTALGASRAIVRTLNTPHGSDAHGLELYASIGIGYGSILQIGDERIAGAEVNLAFKLGEEVASRNEVRLTKAARAQIEEFDGVLEESRVTLAGLEIENYTARFHFDDLRPGQRRTPS